MVVLRNVTQLLVKAFKLINGEGLYVSEVLNNVSAAHKINTSRYTLKIGVYQLEVTIARECCRTKEP